MNVTREQLIRKLSDKSGYYQQDVRKLLKCLDEVVLECFDEVDADNDVSIQIIEGIKLKASLIPQRERVDPRTQEPIMVKATVKPGVKYSELFRERIQTQYESKNDG